MSFGQAIEIGVRLELGAAAQNAQLMSFGQAIEVDIQLKLGSMAHDVLIFDSPSQTCDVKFWG